jgi:hypothetical protein
MSDAKTYEIFTAAAKEAEANCLGFIGGALRVLAGPEPKAETKAEAKAETKGKGSK